MCGICGFNWEDSSKVKEMSSMLRHRGPNESGVYTNNNISFGHQRLSIIDLSANGKQPMCNEEETVWITFNGEIYNYKSLRLSLEKKGHKFKSNTDTEVIIHGYEEWGEQVVQKLNGQFAFAIWDVNSKELFLARDRVGIKPLYYFWDGRKLIFASEIKALLVHKDVPRKMSKEQALLYCNLRYVPGEDTLFEGIKKVLPGNTLTLKDNTLTKKQYWDVPLPLNKEDSLATSTVAKVLEESVKKRLHADVPVGSYLSGGIDSASIVALASKIKKDPISTFTVGFKGNDDADELDKARKIAEHFGTNHHEIALSSSINETMPKLLWYLDMPHGDPVIVPQYHLSKLASSKVKVVLSGEGADELFGGYVQYKMMSKVQKWHIQQGGKVVSPLMKATPVKLLDKAFGYTTSVGSKGKEKVKDLLKDVKDPFKSYVNLTTMMSNKDRKKLFTKDFQLKELSLLKENFKDERKPLLNRMLYYDTKIWMPNYVLHINDRMTMANSIEGRVPFLDHNLVEYASTLSPKFKLHKGRNKIVLREAMRKTLPKQVTSRKKHAFFTPMDMWYKEGLHDLAEQVFTPSTVSKRGVFEYSYLKKIWERYPKSKLLYGKQLFTALNLELWNRMFIDSDNVPKSGDIKVESLL